MNFLSYFVKIQAFLGFTKEDGSVGFFLLDTLSKGRENIIS